MNEKKSDRRFFALSVLALAGMLALVASAAAQFDAQAGGGCGSDGGACGRASSPTQTPACVTAAGAPSACTEGAIALLRPGQTVLPAGVLDGRGARLYQGLCVPSSSCCPLWRGVAGVELQAGPTWAATWGLGLAVYRGTGGLPVRAAATDDAIADCSSEPGGGSWLARSCRSAEQFAFLGRPALASVEGGSVVLVPGIPPVGTSVWRYATGSLEIVYQDGSASGLEAEVVAFGGRLYGLVSGPAQAGTLYDLTAALALGSPVCERCSGGSVRPGVATSAPGVRLGPLPLGAHVAATVAGGRVLVATSGLSGAALWELRPGLGGTLDPALTRRLATLSASGGVAWLEGATLAAVEGDAVVASDWSSTLAGVPGSPPVIWSWPVRHASGDQPLQASRLPGRLIVHRGTSGEWVAGGGISGSTTLEIVGRRVRDVGRTGAVYLDPCSGEETDTWGWMAPRSTKGTNGFEVHDLACLGSVCLRAAESTLDVLALPELSVAEIFADGFESGNTEEWQ